MNSALWGRQSAGRKSSASSSPNVYRKHWSEPTRKPPLRRAYSPRAKEPTRSRKTDAPPWGAAMPQERGLRSTSWKYCAPTCGASTRCASSQSRTSRAEFGALPRRNPLGRNYYLIVEPIAPDGRVLSLPITSEEDGEKATVSRWGVRVSKEVFDQVRQDKNDNGIIDNSRVGEKRRGGLEIDYLMPVQGGVILKW